MYFEKNYKILHPLESVYSAWISSDTVIAPATAMDINPVVGGHYRLIMETPEFRMTNEGEFLEIEPNKYLKYSWEWNADGERTIIEVSFTPLEDGTAVRILHSGFNKKESLDNHNQGWDSYIQGFSQFLSKS